MKRLVKKAEAINLYHGTALANLDNILSSGIKANSNESTEDHNKTFFTNNKDKALHYANIAWSENGQRLNDYCVVLELALDTDILEPDPDCFNCNNWKDSLDSIGSVSINGSVLSSAITKIEIYSPSNDELLFSGSVADYSNNKDNILKELSKFNKKELEEGILKQFDTLWIKFDYIKDYFAEIKQIIENVNNGTIDSEEGYVTINGINSEIEKEIREIDNLIDEYNYNYSLNIPNIDYYEEEFAFENGDNFKAINIEIGNIFISIDEEQFEIEEKLTNDIKQLIINQFYF